MIRLAMRMRRPIDSEENGSQEGPLPFSLLLPVAEGKDPRTEFVAVICIAALARLVRAPALLRAAAAIR
jgi:hypothetical protein